MKNQLQLPNYKDGSIVNLMSSIKKAFGGKSLYQPLKLNGFDIGKLSNKSIVLIIIDGLGYEYLKKYGKNNFLHKNLKGKITSVFPATTAAAITSLMTGVAPQQHGLTGWFMYLKEIGMISAILPFTTRAGNFSLDKKIKYKDIYNQKSFFEGLKANSFFLTHKDYSDSAYSLLVSKGAKRLEFSNSNDFFKQIENTIKKDGSKKFMLAYWAKLDSISHRQGTDNQKTLKHFLWLDKKIALLTKSLKDNNVVIIVTADHGVINTKEDHKIIKLENHPKLTETLELPLSGEPRVVYCYVKPHKVRQFENYVKTKLRNVCELYKSEELIRKNYFGLHKTNEKLKDRVGDYILIMKDNFIMKDLVLGEDRKIFIGNHGGVNKEEIFVPLIVI
jgi:predicted AlkP superfamily pyrophosphatase or phosphodiesterase